MENSACESCIASISRFYSIVVRSVRVEKGAVERSLIDGCEEGRGKEKAEETAETSETSGGAIQSVVLEGSGVFESCRRGPRSDSRDKREAQRKDSPKCLRR